MTDNEIRKAHIGELSKIFDSTEKESQATNITSLAAYQTLLDIEKEANEKLTAEIERLKSGGLINADELFTKFAGHSDYHGDTIHCIIQCMAEGKTVDVAEPLDTSKIKSEAIKEFAERLERVISISAAQKPYFDNLVKEMVGDDYA